MGSQVMEIVVWVFSIVIVSTFFGMIFQVLRGAFDGYMDRWEKNYLDNKKFEDENKMGLQGGDYYKPMDDPFNDPDVQDFLEWADEPGPWSEEDDKIYTVGGLTADKDQGFKKFINKIEGGDSDNNVDDEKEE